MWVMDVHVRHAHESMGDGTYFETRSLTKPEGPNFTPRWGLLRWLCVNTNSEVFKERNLAYFYKWDNNMEVWWVQERIVFDLLLKRTQQSELREKRAGAFHTEDSILQVGRIFSAVVYTEERVYTILMMVASKFLLKIFRCFSGWFWYRNFI